MDSPTLAFQSKKNKAQRVSLERGKVPPQDTALEEVVLGGMLIDKKGVEEVVDILFEEAFYKTEHQLIFKAMFQLFQNSHPIDLFTVIDQLRKNGNLDEVGGESAIIDLTQKVSSAAHIDFHARIILQKFIQRGLIQASNEIIEEAYDETADAIKLIDSAESKLYSVTQGNLKRSSETAGELVIKALKKINSLMNSESEFSGIPSGFNDLDKLTSGWQNSDLIIIAARPGMGKTAFTLSLARNISVGQNIPVAFFSLEMSSVQLIMRLISSETKIESEVLRSGKLEEKQLIQLNSNIQGLEKAPLYIDDSPDLSIFDLRAKARRMVSRYGIKLIIIDYLQLMVGNSTKANGNREQEISTISRGLKALAKELNIPVIALSQLSREVEKRPGHKRPQLSDLRESGAIEQDADIVSFIYRPEYYKIDQWDDSDQTPTKDQAEFIVAKHRNGGLDNIRLRFIGKFGKFDNLSTSSFLSQDYNVSDNEEATNYDFSNSLGSKINDDEGNVPF